MEWLNAPVQWRGDKTSLTAVADSKTDFWRTTHYDFIKDDGHFYFEAVTGNFEVTVKVTGVYAGLYDQAGLMIRERDTVWLKCGVEYLDGVQQASAVLTREFSDWSIVPLSDNPQSVWFRVKRINESLEVLYSRDGVTFHLIRLGYLSVAPTLQVGMMCAAPQGEGFEVTFESYQMVALPATAANA
ncbi:MAG: DUF1349 domain-containing protein [Phototrophicaceae bacterium]